MGDLGIAEGAIRAPNTAGYLLPSVSRVPHPVQDLARALGASPQDPDFADRVPGGRHPEAPQGLADQLAADAFPLQRLAPQVGLRGVPGGSDAEGEGRRRGREGGKASGHPGQRHGGSGVGWDRCDGSRCGELSRICPGWSPPQPGTTGNDGDQPDRCKFRQPVALEPKDRISKGLQKAPVPNPSLSACLRAAVT